MSQPEFDQNTPASLLCPGCGGNNLHHYRTDVFIRKEDANTGLVVSINNATLTTSSDLHGNPSSRRDGVSIRFWCEGCDNVSRLDIVQHKGCTNLQMTTTGEQMPKLPPQL